MDFKVVKNLLCKYEDYCYLLGGGMLRRFTPTGPSPKTWTLPAQEQERCCLIKGAFAPDLWLVLLSPAETGWDPRPWLQCLHLDKGLLQATKYEETVRD